MKDLVLKKTGVVYGSKSPCKELDKAIEKDLWTEIYTELICNSTNFLRTTHFKDYTITDRYFRDGAVSMDRDFNLTVYGKTEDKLKFAHVVAEYYGLKFKDGKSASYVVAEDVNKSFFCKIYMPESTIGI